MPKSTLINLHQYVVTPDEVTPAKRDIVSGKLMQTFRGHQKYISSIALSSDSQKTVIGNGDGTIQLWAAQSGHQLRIKKAHSDVVHSVSFSPDGKSAVSSIRDNTIKLWDTNSGNPWLTFYPFDNGSYVVLDPQGRFDGTPGGLKQLHYVFGLEPVAFDKLKKRFYTPDLWQQTFTKTNRPKPAPVVP